MGNYDQAWKLDMAQRQMGMGGAPFHAVSDSAPCLQSDLTS